MKKSLSIILSILMIAAMLPMNVLTASATEEEIDGGIYCDLSHRTDFDIIKMTLHYADGNNGDVKTIVMESDTPDIWKADVSPNGMVMFEGYTSDGNFVSIFGERKQGTNCLRVTEYNSSSKMFEGVWYQYPCTSHNYEDGICACGEVCFHVNYLDGICGACGYECPHVSYTDGKCDVCDYECTHEWNDGVLTRPTFETAGYYTYTCTLCGEEKTETAKRADATSLNDASQKVIDYIGNDTLTQEAKDEIHKSYLDILKNNGNIFDEFGFVRGDLVEEDQPLIDAITAELEKTLADADEKIASGEYIKADYTEIDEAIKAIDEALENATISEEMANEFSDIKSQLEALKVNENTSMADAAELLERVKAVAETMADCAKGIHSFKKYEELTAPECGKAGLEKAVCDYGCGATDEKEIPALQHIDEDGDYLCDHGCGHEFEKPEVPDEPDTPDEPEQPDEPTDDTCDHLCHKDGILGFFWKIINFFFKLFNIQQYCDCGALHY